MTITVNVNNKDGETIKEKTIEIPVDRLLKGVTKLSVLSFVGSEINRVRPPRRNIGMVFNWMGAFAVTDAIMNFAFPKPKETVVSEEEAVECEIKEEKEKDDE